MGSRERPIATRARFGGALVGLGVLGLGIAHADRVGRTANAILGFLAGPIEEARQLGSALESSGGALLTELRLFVLAGVAAGFVPALVRRRRPGRGTGLCLALCLAAVAHSLLLDGDTASALALYALAVGVHALAVFDPAPDGALAARIEVPLTLVLVGVYAALALYQLDVLPTAFVDEAAYYEAARMQLGELRPDDSAIFRWQGYSFDRFRAQLVPLTLQALAHASLAPGLLGLRLLSAGALGVSLLLAATSLRRQLGPRSALWTLALAGVAPQVLSYGRLGLYLSISILHSVLCFVAVLRLRERPDRRSALAVGVLVGASACSYQLSWFVPVLVGASLAAGWTRPQPRLPARLLALAALTAVLVVLPSLLLLRPGFEAVAEQTFDRRAVWTEDEPAGVASALVRITKPVDADAIAALKERFDLPWLRVSLVARDPHATTLFLYGPPKTLRKALPRFQRESWRVLTHDLDPKSPRSNLSRMLALAVYAPSRELSRWIPPLIPPLLGPLVFVGILEAIRRRREPALQTLLIWVIAGGLLPAVLGGPEPRRAALMWPFAATLAALPLVQLGRSLAALGSWGRALGGGLAALLYLGAVGHGIHGYFGDERRPSTTGLAKLLKALPSDQPLLLAPRLVKITYLLEAVAGRPLPADLRRVASARTGSEILAASCLESPPFTWITADEPEQQRLFAALRRGFRYQSESREGFLLFRVRELRPGACEVEGTREFLTEGEN